MSKVSIVYDVLNGLTLDALLVPYAEQDERALAQQHLERLAHEARTIHPSVWLLDRGYPSFALIQALFKHDVYLVMRCTDSVCTEVSVALAQGYTDTLRTLELDSAERKAKARAQQGSLHVRMVVVPLDNGVQEILLTSLLDTTQFATSIFKDLYAQRWKVEEHYKLCKHILEVENFTALSVQGIEQDFYSTVLCCNLYAWVVWTAQEQLEQQARECSPPKKYRWKVNRNLAWSAVKKQSWEMIQVAPSQEASRLFEALVTQVCRFQVPIRPGRSSPRKRKRHSKFAMNQKRAL